MAVSVKAFPLVKKTGLTTSMGTCGFCCRCLLRSVFGQVPPNKGWALCNVVKPEFLTTGGSEVVCLYDEMSAPDVLKTARAFLHVIFEPGQVDAVETLADLPKHPRVYEPLFVF